jgi:putative ABC transport system substrate-binding protein
MGGEYFTDERLPPEYRCGMNRRHALAALAGLAVVAASSANDRSASGLPHVAIFAALRPGETVATIRERWTGLLAPHGLQPDKNMRLSIIAVPLATPDPQIWEQAARQLIALRPDVIAIGGTATAHMFKRLTREIPIVFNGAEDPVENGLIESLRRPGGNMTGFSGFGAQLHAKRLELLKEVKPTLKRVANLESSDYREDNEKAGRWLGAAAARLDIDIQHVILPDYSPAATIMKEVANKRAEALLWGVFQIHEHDFTALLERFQVSRLLHVLADHRSAEAGALMALGESMRDRHGREEFASLVIRVLRGEPPGTIPVVQVAKIELTINLATARRMALAIPPSVLARADRLIP